MTTIILCGGKGTRLGPALDGLPKPLLPIGDRPIVWHIMKIYASFGYLDFVLAAGHLAEQFTDYFDNDENRASDWRVSVVDTGKDTGTAGRIKRLEERVQGTFFATYGDGVADVDLDALLRFHREHGRIATVTVVRPRLGFGIARIDEGGRITGFEEKPVMSSWVNGGFFVFEPAVFAYLGEGMLERDPFEQLAADGELMAFEHGGFWACMDTYKDHLELNEHWQRGDAEWKVWS
jgi:glucose-1-phosphate cytidylyltransferase